MKVSLNRLQTYFEDKLPEAERLSEVLTFHFAEVEEIEKSADDTVMDVKILPDRTYAKTYEGLAAEISGILNLKLSSQPGEYKQHARTITARTSDIVQILGIEISEDQIISILQRLWIGVEKNGDELLLKIPNDRQDLQDWRDIPEEVGRIYGYDKINAVVPTKGDFEVPVNKTLYYAEKIKNFLVDLGFSEVYLYSLVSKGDFEIEKPLAADKNHLRTNLSDGLAKSLELNAKNADLLGLDEIKIFEVGKVFTKDGEHTSLAVGIKNIKKKQEKETEKIKKVRDELFQYLGSAAKILCTPDDSGGIISLDGQSIGTTNSNDGMLELNLDALIGALSQPASYADLNFAKAVNIQYKKFSHYPFIVRDIAVFVPESVVADEVWTVIRRGIEESRAAELVARYSLFDTFSKAGKTSYAYRIIFQSHEKTLTDEEVNQVMEKINVQVSSRGWEVR